MRDCGADGDLTRQFTEAGARIEPVLEEMFPRGKDDWLSEPFWHHMAGGGKRIRPALCLLCCEELGGDSDKALDFAAAVEILHNMLLIHDDIEDGDTVRRDAPTVWAKFGVANGVNVGDYMLGRAYSAILAGDLDERVRTKLVSLFTETYEQTCRGQALDLNSRGKEDFSVEDYLEMAILKTGHYLMLGMAGGAVVAGLDDAALGRIQSLGDKMGPAFQIRDDVIDLTKGKGRGGSLGNDVREGKPSILYAHALSAAPAGKKDRLLEIIRRPREKTTDADVAEVIGLYREFGSIEFATHTADRLVREAFEMIEELPPGNRDFFRRVAGFMAYRQS